MMLNPLIQIMTYNPSTHSDNSNPVNPEKPRQNQNVQAAGGKKRKASKYKNIKVESGGKKFDSKKEFARYNQLLYREKAGEITELETQVKYDLIVNKCKIAKYVCDFRYKENGQVIVEDVKSPVTRTKRDYRIRYKLMKALHGIEIKEI